MHQESLNSILIVDHSPDMLEMMSFILRQAGYRVATAVDGRGVLEIAKRQSPDIIISDVSMPGMDGVELSSPLQGRSGLDMLKEIRTLRQKTSRSDSERTP